MTGVLAVVPARGGSKGVPRKNLHPVAGQPLIGWTLDAALASDCVDRVVVSSEDDEILAVAARWGDAIPLRRPPELALDTTPGIEPVLHAIEAQAETFTRVVLLQPTSPLRTAADIDAMMAWMVAESVPCCLSVSPAGHPPHWTFTLDDRHHLERVVDAPPPIQRQQAPDYVALNGALYAAEVPWLLQHRTFLHADSRAWVMPVERSLDVDSAFDLELCEAVLERREREHP
ncbi:MAG: acylneuraminate cytidylyltransferase family protein [Myxococcota bacterium]